MATPGTDASTQRLSDVARHVVIPEGIVTTAWPRVVAKCSELGVHFDGWQHGIGAPALGKRADGKYAATVGGIVLSIPRQVGKTFLVGMIVIALCLLHPGLTVLWSAHRTRTATKTFGALKGMTSRRKIKAHMLEPRNTNGEQEIRFRNGSVVMFGAREQGFGRGFDEVDIEVFDEAQILTEKALEDMVAATNQSRQESGALLFFMGTPPRPGDPGEEFTNRRTKALSGKAKNMVYVELSADRDADSDDHTQWAKANPSFPHRTPVESMERMRENLTDEASFRREALGIWDEAAAASTRLIPASDWEATGVTEAPDGVRSFGIAFSASGERQAVAGAVKHPGGVHVELVGAHSGSTDAGIGALADWLTTDPLRPERWRTAATIVICGRSHAGVLHRALRDRGVPERVLHIASTEEYCTASASLPQAVTDRTLTRPKADPDDSLEQSIAVCDKKARGTSGAWGWHATTPDGDETPTEAISLALWGAKTTRRKPGRKAVVSY